MIVGLWRKDWVDGLLAAYLFFILTETVLIRKTGALRYELVPFWSWKRPDLRAQIYVNILLFVPVGFLLGLKTGWKSIPLAAGMSAAIELIQLATRRGLFEFDDIIHNTLGAVIGFGLWRLLKKQLHSET